MKTKLKDFSFVTLGILIAYLPVLLFDYGAHNDFFISIEQSKQVYNLTHGYFNHAEAVHLILYGRPLNAFLHNLQFKFIGSLIDLHNIRILSVVIIALLGILFFWFCRKTLLTGKALSIALAFGIVLTPSFQLFAYWASNLVPGLIASVLGLVAGIIYIKAQAGESRVKKFIGISIAILLFIMGLLTYPPNASQFLVPIVLWCVFKPEEITIKVQKLCWAISVYLIAIVLFFCFIKLEYRPIINWLMPQMTSQWESSHYTVRAINIHELPSRLDTLFRLIAPEYLIIGQGFLSPILAHLLCPVFALVFFISIIRRNWAQALSFVILAVSFILVSIPLIAPVDWVPGIRNTAPQFALGSIALIYLVFTLFDEKWQRKEIAVAAYSIIAFLMALSAHVNTFNAAQNAFLECDFVQRWVKNSFNPDKKEINVILMSPSGSVITKNVPRPISYISSEFYQLATNYTFMPGIVEFAIRSAGYDPSNYHIKEANSETPFHPKANVNLLNMNDARANFLEGKITASSQLGEFSPNGLLFSQEPGWHSKIKPDFPQLLMVELNHETVIHGVQFLPQGSHSERAPKHIKIITSLDGYNWHKVAEPSNLCKDIGKSNGWSPNWRLVNFDQEIKVKFLRIEILSNCGDPNLVTLRGLRFLTPGGIENRVNGMIG